MINNKLNYKTLLVLIFIFLAFILNSYSKNNVILYYKLETNYNNKVGELNLPKDVPKDSYQENLKNVVDFYITEDKIKINAKELSNDQIVTDTSLILQNINNKINFYIIDNIQKVYSLVNQENIDNILQNQNQMKELVNNSTIKKEGTEKIGNILAEKYSVFYKNKKILELYVVDYKKLIPIENQQNFKKLYLESDLFNKFNSYFNELGNKFSNKISPEQVPIKYNLYENDQLALTTLLKEIKFIDYNNNYFEIPSDYKKIEFK
ncbi:MAG: hypothetical protein ACP5O4_05935 [bacterium]